MLYGCLPQDTQYPVYKLILISQDWVVCRKKNHGINSKKETISVDKHRRLKLKLVSDYSLLTIVLVESYAVLISPW